MISDFSDFHNTNPIRGNGRSSPSAAQARRFASNLTEQVHGTEGCLLASFRGLSRFLNVQRLRSRYMLGIFSAVGARLSLSKPFGDAPKRYPTSVPSDEDCLSTRECAPMHVARGCHFLRRVSTVCIPPLKGKLKELFRKPTAV